MVHGQAVKCNLDARRSFYAHAAANPVLMWNRTGVTSAQDNRDELPGALDWGEEAVKARPAVLHGMPPDEEVRTSRAYD